jgi:hypothetical protein
MKPVRSHMPNGNPWPIGHAGVLGVRTPRTPLTFPKPDVCGIRILQHPLTLIGFLRKTHEHRFQKLDFEHTSD